jgi:hypothetical protein
MRIGVFHNSPYYLRYYETALGPLLDRGHHLVLARPERYERVKIPSSLRRTGQVSTALYPDTRSDGTDRAIEIVRTARDAARYLTPELRAAHASRQRAFERLIRVISDDSGTLAAVDELSRIEWTSRELAAVQRVFEDLERLIPPNERTVRFIREQQLDRIFCITRMNIAALQTEVVKAASRLAIPTGVAVYSWDNLSNKGGLHVRPDQLFVWNEIQVREAVELHGVDRSLVRATGTPRFDAVFAGAPSAGRADLLRELGLDPARATVLYLGSSTFVAPREPEFVSAWTSSLRTSSDERLRDANVIVRPHPGARESPAWVEWRPSNGQVARPPHVVRDRNQDLFDQIFASDAVVGLNTSAEIEAAILDKPVLTVKAGALAPGQEGQLHFRYLLEEHGGFVRTAAALDEHVGQLAEALSADTMAAARRRFLESFVRPLGIDVPAGPALADAIEALSRERPPARNGRPALDRLARLVAEAYGVFHRTAGAPLGSSR